jgi:hypothetical protein
MVIFRKNQKDDAENFVEFLTRIVEKKKNENVNTLYNDKKASFKFLLIGRKEIILRYGFDPYVNRIKNDAKRGVRNFFIIASGNINCAVASLTIREVTRHGILKLIDIYEGDLCLGNERKRVLISLLENNSKSENEKKNTSPPIQIIY